MSNNVCKVSTIYYDNLRKFNNLTEVFAWQRNAVFNPDNSWYNGPTEDGMIISPYLTLKVNGEEFPVYSARATFSTHSFAYAEVEGDGDFCLNVELHLNQKRNTVVVLPETNNVKAIIEGDFDVKATITKTGSFSFVFDHYTEGAFTLMVRLKYPFAIPEGYEVEEINPGVHALEETQYKKSNMVYYYRHGVHFVHQIDLPSNCMLYLEEGAIIRLTADDPTRPCPWFITTNETENVTICGKGAIDYSPRIGTSAFSFVRCNNATVRDLTLINSPGWTVCFTNCKNVRVTELLIVAYRIFSDGIMLSDCIDGYISDCFIRTGDDAAEVKSTSGGYLKTDNVLFKNIAAWTDKACGFGVVFECNNDTQNVHFEDCSVGFALPNWSPHLGCINMHTGNNPNATDYNVYFKNFEIYYTLCSPITYCAHQGNIKDIYVENVKVKYCFHKDPILVWIKDKDKASIGNLYLDNIEIQNVKLTEENRDQLISYDVPEGAYDKKNVFINTLKKQFYFAFYRDKIKNNLILGD